MKHLISSILIRTFGFPENSEFEYFNLVRDDFFYASFNLSINSNDMVEKERKYNFKYDKNILDIEENIEDLYETNDVDFSLINGLENDLHKSNLFINNALKNNSKLKSQHVQVRIKEDSDTYVMLGNEDKLNVVASSSSIYEFEESKYNRASINILDSIIEYYIRDHVFVETGLVIYEDIEFFILAFKKTDCEISFVNETVSLSTLFKSYISFKNQDEMKEIVKLFKINYSV